ncbi:hypothetical protein AGMMS50276_00420 [Synergistales bacterium]|nr:hypothetical protein AGMMS50276_00420 [Synergistales bacterium]
MKEKVINTEREEALRRFALISPLLEEGVSVPELAERRCALLGKENIFRAYAKSVAILFGKAT